MELQLINGLEHQQIAVDNIAAVFAGVAWGAHENWQNPALMDERGVIEHNLHILQNAEVNNIPSAGYVRAHFAHDYAGGVELCEVKPQGAKKGSRRIYPQAVREFVEGNAPNKIYVLLLNMQLLTNAKVLTADDYDRSERCTGQSVRGRRRTRGFRRRGSTRVRSHGSRRILRDDGVAVRFEKQINNRGIRQILEELME